MGQPKISVIIPVCNVEEYLRECLDSVINQTLQDIEIICVDDCSEDTSAEILEEYRRKDSRVKVQLLPLRSSAFVARKRGVLQAKGEYIWFLDADDYIEPVACENLYTKIKETGAEILHFSSKVENCGNATEERIQMNEKLLKPQEGKLDGRSVFESCFIERTYGFTLWNKLFSAELCKKAFLALEDAFLPKAQDLYSYFAISYFATSYFGWNSDAYYHYCFGRGVTGTAQISLNIFERYCRQADVVKALTEFSDAQKIENAAGVIERLRIQWISECIQLWYNQINMRELEQATRILWENWFPLGLVEQIAKKYWFARDVIAQRIGSSLTIPMAQKKVKTIAIYYYHYTIGGVQKVISLMMPMLQNLGYKVVLVTDAEPGEHDFVLPQGIERIVVPHYQKTSKDNIELRLQRWNEIVDRCQIDLVIYHAWTSPLLLWDCLNLQGQNIPVIVQTHSVFSYSLVTAGRDFSVVPRVLAISDGIVTLSKADKAFWDCFHQNVHYIPNPIDDELRQVVHASGDGKNIVWIGRFSNEKQPWEALNIMEQVVRQEPDAVLYMVGGAADTSTLEKFQKVIDKKDLTAHVKLEGYQQDVSRYYTMAQVSLLTSQYEGFSMVLLEAQAHGVPSVMYKMPYLELAREERGVIGVEPNNRKQAALEIVRLLQDKEEWSHRSAQAIASFEQMADYPYSAAWKMLLDGEQGTSSVNEPVKMMVDTVLNHYLLGWNKNQKLSGTRKLADIGNAGILLRLVRKLYGGLLCYHEHGWRYTWQRILVHLHLREDPFK